MTPNEQKQAIKELMYGGLSELMHNSRYYYHSSVGKNYSHWTEEGKIAVTEFVNEITHYMHNADQASLDKRAKELVLKELKGS